MNRSIKLTGLLMSIFLLVSMLNVLVVFGATSTLSPTDDSYVYQSNSTTNYGTATSMFVKTASGSDRLTFLKFSMSGLSGITNAKLRVNQSVASNTVNTTTLSSGGTGCTNALSSATAIQDAMKNATPGTIIRIAPGTYTGIRATSGDPRVDGNGVPTGVFYSGASGTSSNPIVIEGCDPANPPILQGSAANDGSYGIHLTGDYWEIRNIKVTRAQKGIMIDNGNNNLIHTAEIYNVGDEGVHFRDGSSYNILDNSNIHDTGKYQAGYGEGAYVGSDQSAAYEHTVINNIIRYTTFGPGISAEHIDIKEGADGTLVEYCSFNGKGISGANSADSFIDVKGVNSKVYNNTGSRNGNSHVVDAFQNRTHGSSYPTGTNNDFKDNSVNLDGVGYIVNAVGGSAKVKGNTRSDGSSNLYKGKYTLY